MGALSDELTRCDLPLEVSRSRWWVLLVFGLSSGTQGLMWMTYSSVPDDAKAFLEVEDAQLNLILNEGPVAYVLVSALAAWLLRTKGLRWATACSVVMCVVAAILRTIPAWTQATPSPPDCTPHSTR